MFFNCKTGVSKSEESLKESIQLINNALLLRRSVPTTETGDRGHQLVDIRAGGADLAVLERVHKELSRLSFFQILAVDNLLELAFPLLFFVISLIITYYVWYVNVNENLSQVLTNI